MRYAIFPGLKNQVYSIVNVSGQQLYSYRDSFHVLLKTKISTTKFSQLEGHLLDAWKTTVAGRVYIISE